ncbi:MAG TPA: FHA domain-containing protein, partial [Dehalococcoidia bacterium]|nr:FHA domain-containing protein [Dehalococcoidia bacterium]
PSGAEHEVRLDREVIRIGRARDCDVPLESGYVSRYHARLERSGHDWALVDEGSKNGVILNGRRITGSHALYSGDTIRMGDFTLIFNLADTQDEDRTIIYPFAAAELEAELLARRAEKASAAAPPAPEPAAPVQPAAPEPAQPFHTEETRRTPAAPPPSSLDRRELAAFTVLTAAAEAGAERQSLGDATWQPGAWDGAMLERLVARLDRKLRDHDDRTIACDDAGRYRIAAPAGVH